MLDSVKDTGHGWWHPVEDPGQTKILRRSVAMNRAYLPHFRQNLFALGETGGQDFPSWGRALVLGQHGKNVWALDNGKGDMVVSEASS